MPSAAAERTRVAANDKNVGMGGKCFVEARGAAEGRRGHVTRVDDVTVHDVTVHDVTVHDVTVHDLLVNISYI